MELVLLLQDDDKMFVGNRPKKAEGIYTSSLTGLAMSQLPLRKTSANFRPDYLKRFTLCMGYSVTSLAKNTRRTTHKASPKGPRGLENSFELS